MTVQHEPPRAVDGTPLIPAETLLRSYLAGLGMTHRFAEMAIANRRESVALAREVGATWEDIGRAMGMTRQLAHKRFGRGLDPPV